VVEKSRVPEIHGRAMAPDRLAKDQPVAATLLLHFPPFIDHGWQLTQERIGAGMILANEL
jgi:hypothetical protein